MTANNRIPAIESERAIVGNGPDRDNQFAYIAFLFNALQVKIRP